MLPDVGFAEFLIIGVVALIVVGPRDLPRLAKAVGGYVRQARGLAREFQKSFDEMGKEIELQELRKEVEALKRGEPFDDVKEELRAVEREVKAVETEARTGKPAAGSGNPDLTQVAAPPAEPTTPTIAPPDVPEDAATPEPSEPPSAADEPPPAKKEAGGSGG